MPCGNGMVDVPDSRQIAGATHDEASKPSLRKCAINCQPQSRNQLKAGSLQSPEWIALRSRFLRRQQVRSATSLINI